jgi:hypothetical protein
LKEFKSEIIHHNSMYNDNQESLITDEIIKSIGGTHGRLFLFEQFFLWFNDYFKHYLKTMNCILKGDGLLPKTWRYYIAIMAASTMKSDYMLKLMEENFLELGGDENWLVYGLDLVPEKLSKLSKINSLLAHQPWKIRTEDIKVLLIN